MNRVSVWFIATGRSASKRSEWMYPMVMVHRRKQRYYYRVSTSSLRRLVNLITGKITIHYDGWSVVEEEVVE